MLVFGIRLLLIPHRRHSYRGEGYSVSVHVTAFWPGRQAFAPATTTQYLHRTSVLIPLPQRSANAVPTPTYAPISVPSGT